MEQKTVISERYEVLDTLGKGGMGLVLKCEDKVLKRTVAVKVLGDKPSPEAIKRFQIEARAAAKLKQSNILQVLDFGETDDGRLFLVMDYVAGGTLTQLLKQRTFLPVEVAVPLFEQICKGISHAHKQGVLHRDIKPSNVMLVETSDDEWLIKIVDFGIAKLTSDDQKLTTTGAVVGSPPYIAPEAALNQLVDVRSDVYSIGCLMFETLTGSPPYQGETAVATILMHNNEAVPSLASRSEEKFDSAMEKIIEKSLAKNPADRYQSVEELCTALDALSQVLAEQAGSADKDTSPTQVLRTTTTSKWPLVTTGIFLLFVLAGAAMVAQRITTERKRPAEYKPVAPMRLLDVPAGKDIIGPKKITRDKNGGAKSEPDTDDEQIGKQFDEFEDTESWNFSESKINKEGLETIARSRVKMLNLKKTDIDNECMRIIGGIHDLRFLDVVGCEKLSAKGFDYLQNNDKLEVIQFSIPPGREAALQVIEAIGRVKNLRVLTITGTMNGAMIARIKTFKTVNHMRIDVPTENGWEELEKHDHGHLTRLEMIVPNSKKVLEARAHELGFKNVLVIKRDDTRGPVDITGLEL